MATTAFFILTYNSQKYILNCLKSITKQTNQDFQIYLIDNNSTDNTVNLVIKEYPKVKIIKHQFNYGVGKGFNLALKSVGNKYKYIFLLNPDTTLNKDCLELSLKTFSLDKTVDITATTIIYHHSQKIDTMGGRIINLFAGIFGGIHGGKNLNSISKTNQSNPYPAFFAVITGMLVKSSSFKKFGYFDENYFMYFEDIDFCWRVLNKGGTIKCQPLAKITHYGHGSVHHHSSHIYLLKIIETNLLSTYFKNLSIFSLIIVLPVLIIFRSILSLIYFFISPKISIEKISGIFNFISLLFSSNIYQQRKNSQSKRQRTDLQVFLYSNNSLFSIPELIKNSIPWLQYSKSGKHASPDNKKFTGERIINSNPNSVLFKTAINRYKFAKPYISNSDNVLDIACGLAYGSQIIASSCKNIIGLDVDNNTINFNNANNKINNLKYYLIKPEQYLKQFHSYFNVILSFETIEHSSNRSKFLKNIKSYCGKKATVILSTPNNYLYKNPPKNPYHKYEYKLEELYLILKKVFPKAKILIFGQTKTDIFKDDPPKIKTFRNYLTPIYSSIYDFDSKYLHFIPKIEHYSLFKKIGSFQKSYSYNEDIYPINLNNNYQIPETSLFIIKQNL